MQTHARVLFTYANRMQMIGGVLKICKLMRGDANVREARAVNLQTAAAPAPGRFDGCSRATGGTRVHANVCKFTQMYANLAR